MENAMNIREDMVELVRGYDGVSVSSDRNKYIDLLGPQETAAMWDYFCNPATSGCALSIRGFWRKMGVSDNRIVGKYVFGKAVEWLVGVARSRGAWNAAAVGKCPRAGDFVLVGGNPAVDGGVEHVFTVCTVEMDSKGNAVLTSVDGGQRDSAGQQAILSKGRRWTVRGGAIWDVSKTGSDPGAGAAGGRRVKGWGDLEKIMAAEVAAGAPVA
jgi:hypothetical protein